MNFGIVINPGIYLHVANYISLWLFDLYPTYRLSKRNARFVKGSNAMHK